MASRAYRGGIGLREPPTASRGPIYDKYYSTNQSLITDEIAPKKRNPWLIVAIIAAVIIILAIIGLVIWLLLRNNSSNNNNNNGGGGTTPTNPVGGACTTASNCNSGLVCDNNICKNPPRGSCSNDNQCTAGYLCSGGTCLGAGGGTCTANEDCMGAFNCINNTCTQTVCTSDTDCRAGYICNTITSTCTGGIGDSCLDSTQCQFVTPFQIGTLQGGIAFCSSQTHECGGVPGSVCKDDTECAYPFVCTSGLCAYRTCNNTADCPTTTVPDTFPECIANTCVIKPGGSSLLAPTCTNDSQCDSRTFEGGAERRCGGNTKLCGLYGGVSCAAYPGIGSICAADPVFDCPAGTICLCSNSAQCQASQPNCVASHCQATPEPSFERTNILNMRRKTKENRNIRKKIGAKYMKDGDNIDEDDMMKEEEIRHTGRDAHYREMVNNMIRHV